MEACSLDHVLQAGTAHAVLSGIVAGEGCPVLRVDFHRLEAHRALEGGPHLLRPRRQHCEQEGGSQ